MILSNEIIAMQAETADCYGTLETAIVLAATVHAGQKDKAGEPYILHPLRVMACMETPEERIVAVLHDTLEDSEMLTETRLRQMFAPEIVDAVVVLTRLPGEPYIHQYIPRVKENPLARKVKISDLIDNLDPERMPDLDEETLARVTKYRCALEMLA